MIKLNKNNLDEFLNYYHYFHDSYIINISYDISKSIVELLVNVYWSGEPKLREDGTYQTNKIKMKMQLTGIEKYNNKEIFSWNYIDDVSIKYVNFNGKELLCFADDEVEPLIYIICDNIEYEEID